MSEQKERPPYVTFETRAVEDRDASIAAGHYRAKDIDYVLVTPRGSKDRSERVVTEWFEQLAQNVREERFPPEWLQGFRAAYADWKEGREVAINGTSILNWPALSPAQVRQLQEAKIKTIEDLAVANEEQLSRLGMGARALKQMAIAWLDSANNTGRTAGELAAVRQENEDLRARNESLEKRMEALEKKLSSEEA